MDATEILKRVRKIEIKIKGLSKHIFSGEYHSAFKGRGMSFSEVREYQYGDDVRNIDWNVTARTGDPFIKIFEEDRELTVMLIVDKSGSSAFGTKSQWKIELMTEIAALLSFAAVNNNDKVGLILYAGEVEKYIPPKKGRKHILRIIREILYFEPKTKGSNLEEALKYFSNISKKRNIAFVLSDYYDEGYGSALTVAAKRHDMIGIRILDQAERDMPSVGVIHALDPETGEYVWLDSSSESIRRKRQEMNAHYDDYFSDNFAKSRSDKIVIHTGDDYLKTLLQFFKRRSK